MKGEVAPGWWAGARSMGVVIGIALAVRLAVFPFAENKQADAPMRALIAERNERRSRKPPVIRGASASSGLCRSK